MREGCSPLPNSVSSHPNTSLEDPRPSTSAMALEELDSPRRHAFTLCHRETTKERNGDQRCFNSSGTNITAKGGKYQYGGLSTFPGGSQGSSPPELEIHEPSS